MSLERVHEVINYQEKKQENLRIWLERYLNAQYNVDGWEIKVIRKNHKEELK